jgi:hypothetical protein
MNVRVGQIWESTDPRDGGRRFKIIRLPAPAVVECQNLVIGRVTTILMSRLRPLGKRGYRLVEES